MPRLPTKSRRARRGAEAAAKGDSAGHAGLFPVDGIRTGGIHAGGTRMHDIHAGGIHAGGTHTDDFHAGGIHTDDIHTGGIHTGGIRMHDIHAGGIHRMIFARAVPLRTTSSRMIFTQA